MDYKGIVVVKNTIDGIIDTLIDAARKPHDEYESVKLYGNSELILKCLKHIMSSDKYDGITIASLDITSSDIDSVCKDDYILTITDDQELYIQSAWNDDILFANEAKFVICQYGISSLVVENVLRDNTEILIAKIITQK